MQQENQHSEHFSAVDEKLNQYTESLKPLKKNKNFSYSGKSWTPIDHGKSWTPIDYGKSWTPIDHP
jgi:hypothetical protein